jgi:undecaprenyl-diphosphatase
MPSFFLRPPKRKLVRSAVLSALIVMIFAALAIFSNTLQVFDQNVEQFLSFARRPALNGFFLAITYLGSVQFVSIALVFLALFFLLRKNTPYYFVFLGIMLGNAASVFIVKNLVERARPATAMYVENSFSFPSGHTAISVVFFGLLAYLAAKNSKRATVRGNIFIGWIFLMIMIGFSRMYLGVHFASDVLAGYAIGFFSLCVGIILFETLYEDQEKWWVKALHKYFGKRQ